MDTGKFTDIMDKKVKKVYIKDGKRKMPTDTGHMMMSAQTAKRMFGAHMGGKYSKPQKKIEIGSLVPKNYKGKLPKSE